ncbi:MAG TPA: ammonia-forming cytochrome c nitrite reductase subunit c552 [Desulfobacteria bacterium]|nr:ammonia-forming cytochrome c nitrite reductase subunit c552 [Desulfobacteria bacterium]
MVKKVIVLTALICGIFIFASCARQEAKKPQVNQQKQQGKSVVEIVYGQWKGSGHATAVEADNPTQAPGLREEGKCFLCHNGYAYETQASTLKGIGILKGASCDTCHTGFGRSLMVKGSVTIPLGDIKGGKGALCMSCHSGRGKAPDQKSAPHYSVQTDVLLSKSGAEVKGFNYGSSPHAGASNTCLACHMAQDKNGFRDHSFKMKQEQVANTCGNCHNFDTFNPPAKADYDGDGRKEGIQSEVAGLLGVVKGAIDKKLDGGKFTSAAGKIQFEDKQAKVLSSPPSPEVYNAAWNYFLINNDGSKGVHNPAYAVQLLQQTYKELMGADVPKAELRK